MDRAYFFTMPRDETLLKRALARTPEQMIAELEKVLANMRERLAEGGTPEQVKARQAQIDAAERALGRLKRKGGSQ